MQRDIVDLLEDILEAADFITADTAGATFDAFVADRRIRQLASHNFLIIGEAVNRLSRRDPAVVERISSHEQIIAFRNVLIHGYDLVDYPTIWRAIHESLPVLRHEVEALLREMRS
jgi:uncharacterized protein with HEPN domain